MTRPVVALVTLGRPAMGEVRRVETWEALLGAAGADVRRVAVVHEHRRRLPVPPPADLVHLGRGRLVPETAVWSSRAAVEHLTTLRPAAIVVVTGRAWHPALAGVAPVVLDLVDRLGVNYRDRAQLVSRRAARVPYRVLSLTADRFERAALADGRLRVVAAGWSECQALGIDWIPNVITPSPGPFEPPAPIADAGRADLVFFGTLSYPPNVEALERLDQWWEAVQQRRPHTSALVAGRQPTSRVRALAAANGWRVEEDFASVPGLLARASVAVAPLASTSGLQNKVLEAAAWGMPQVVTPAAVAGFAPGLPVAVAEGAEPFAAVVVALLDDPDERRRSGDAARAHVEEHYGVARWAPVIAELTGLAFRSPVAADAGEGDVITSVPPPS